MGIAWIFHILSFWWMPTYSWDASPKGAGTNAGDQEMTKLPISSIMASGAVWSMVRGISQLRQKKHPASFAGIGLVEDLQILPATPNINQHYGMIKLDSFHLVGSFPVSSPDIPKVGFLPSRISWNDSANRLVHHWIVSGEIPQEPCGFSHQICLGLKWLTFDVGIVTICTAWWLHRRRTRP